MNGIVECEDQLIRPSSTTMHESATFLKGSYGGIGDGVNESQQGVQHSGDFDDEFLALRKIKHIAKERRPLQGH